MALMHIVGMALMQIIGMIAVLNSYMPAIRSVNVGVAVMNLTTL